MFRKRGSEIDEEDLRALVENRQVEDERLDFKREMYGRNDADSRSMIRDVIAMANHRGGLILIGVDEDEEGAARAVVGVDYDRDDERILQALRANVAPPLAGVSVHRILLRSGRSVLVVEIPQSLDSPHMTTREGENRFWRRYGRQNDKMPVEEIRAAFHRRGEEAMRVEAFFADRLRRLEPDSAEVRLVLQAACLFGEDGLVDTNNPSIRTLLASPPSSDKWSHADCRVHAPVFPSLFGARAESVLSQHEHIELWRNGYLEYTSGKHLDGNFIPSRIVISVSYSFIHLYREILSQSLISSPVVIQMSIVMSPSMPRSLTLAVDRDSRVHPHPDPERTWREHRLVLPSVVLSDLAIDTQPAIEHLNDRLWNAFGWERCWPLFEEGGASSE